MLQGFTDERQAGSIRSDIETGAPKTRKRFTAAIRKIKWPTILTGTQRATFDTFYITTTNEGADVFTITDPVDGSTTLNVKFLKAPSWTITNSQSTTATDRVWSSTYDLEVQP